MMRSLYYETREKNCKRIKFKSEFRPTTGIKSINLFMLVEGATKVKEKTVERKDNSYVFFGHKKHINCLIFIKTITINFFAVYYHSCNYLGISGSKTFEQGVEKYTVRNVLLLRNMIKVGGKRIIIWNCMCRKSLASSAF